MKKITLVAGFVVCGLSPAFAADTKMPPATVVYDWSGFYAGAFAGGAWGHVDVHDDHYNVLGGSDFGYDPSGFIGGLTIGHNWQVNHFVYGAEGEIGYLGLDDSAQYPPFRGLRGPDDSVAKIKSDFYASLTGRIGYAFDNVLIYAKGGVAGLNTKVSFIDSDPAGLTLDSGTSARQFKIGYTIGGGVELGLSPNWTIKAEYMFADFGRMSHTATDSLGIQDKFTHDLDPVNTIKIGFNYKF